MKRSIPILILVSLCLLSAAQAADFYSQAKLIVGGSDLKPKLPDGGDIPADFYSTNLQILQSAQLRTSSLERVRLTNPEVKECAVALRAVWVKDSRIFELTAKGDEPRFTRLFLDGVLDEFLAFRSQFDERVRNKKLTAMAEDIIKREAVVKESAEKLKSALKGHISLEVLEAEEKRLIARLMELRTERDKDPKANSDAVKNAETAVESATLIVQKIKALQKEYSEWEASYKRAFDEVHAYQVAEEAKSDVISVLSHATPAEEMVKAP